MATGENAGTWGTKTNTNLQIFEQISGGFIAKSIAGSAQTTPLNVSDGSTGAEMAHRMIEFTGTITGNQIVTIPLDAQTFYFLRNSTSGAYTVQFKYTSGSGDSFTFSATDKGDQLVFATGNDVTNPDIYTLGFGDVTLTGTETLTNKTLTSPKIGTAILDTGGNELINLTATGSAVNEITLANAATGNAPTITASGETNVSLNLVPKGTGTLQGNGAALKIAGKETMWVPAQAMYGATTNGADAKQVETTATRPDMKVLDFDPSTIEYAQFSVAFPKSWNEGTITYQVYWTPSSTNTGNCIYALQGVACADSDTIDVAYGTAVEVTDAGIGTVEDQQITSESGAVTVAGSPAAGEQTYFQLFRNASDGSDTFTGDARVLGIRLFFTTDAANDA
tara:strand:+ start:1 stop:1182 length:1182 start_codon:yes stop_codon:yes gene_type:complete